MTTELYLVRHGETDWNLQHRIQGLTDIPLNDTGRAQARTTGALLARRTWDGIFTSPLVRARETAELIAEAVGLPEPGVLPALVERNYGEAEGMEYTEIERRFPGRDVPGQESREDVVARVVPALRDLAAAHRGSSLIVVSHGGAIRSVLTAAEPEATFGRIVNGSVHSFLLDDELRLVAFNDPVTVDDPDAESLDEQNAVEAREGGAA